MGQTFEFLPTHFLVITAAFLVPWLRSGVPRDSPLEGQSMWDLPQSRLAQQFIILLSLILPC